MNKQECLAMQLATHIAWFDKESKGHKQLHRKLRYVVFSLTALSTVLAGLALAATRLQAPINVAIVLTTATAGLASSVEGLRKPGELWIHERTLLYALKDLKRKLEFCTSEEHDPKIVDTIFSEMQDVLGSARERWSRQVADKAAGNPPDRPGPA
ncbi:MAG TPA: DUF4231 domain-containing protein [Rhodanobacter sp.]